MIDYEKYDPARDADESNGHLCNSLNAMKGMYRKRSRRVGDEFDRLSDYIERAEATIWYLRKLVEKGDTYGKTKV